MLASNCTLAFTVNNGGSGYTTASVILAGGYCPGATATADFRRRRYVRHRNYARGRLRRGAGVIIWGDGRGAEASAVLAAAAPVAVYSGTTGALVGSTFLYQNGVSGPYYATVNTACVNNGSYPNRLYVSDQPDQRYHARRFVGAGHRSCELGQSGHSRMERRLPRPFGCFAPLSGRPCLFRWRWYHARRQSRHHHLRSRGQR